MNYVTFFIMHADPHEPLLCSLGLWHGTNLRVSPHIGPGRFPPLRRYEMILKGLRHRLASRCSQCKG